MCGLQGKKVYLGTFPDPVSAAKRYDEAAAEYRGAKAVLNFPSGHNSTPSLAGADHQAAELPLGGGCGQEGPAASEQLPPGNAKGSPAPPSGTLAINEGSSGVGSLGSLVVGQDC